MSTRAENFNAVNTRETNDQQSSVGAKYLAELDGIHGPASKLASDTALKLSMAGHGINCSCEQCSGGKKLANSAHPSGCGCSACTGRNLLA